MVIASYHGTVHTCISALNCRQLLSNQRLDLSTYVCPALRALAQHALGKCVGSMPSSSKAWLADTGRFWMHFALWWTRKGRLHEESLRDPLIVVFAVSRDLQKHHQWKTSPNTLVLSGASKALPLRVEGRGGTHHILDGWGSAQESVQGNGHGGGLWSPGWGMPEEKGTEKGRGFTAGPTEVTFLWRTGGEHPTLDQVAPRSLSVQLLRACATASDEISAPSLDRHLICESGDFLASSNLHILRCKVAE